MAKESEENSKVELADGEPKKALLYLECVHVCIEDLYLHVFGQNTVKAITLL